MFILYENGAITYKVNMLWRDINEYTMYVLIPILIYEIVKLNIRTIILTVLCVITAYLLTQSITADGTRLDIWF